MAMIMCKAHGPSQIVHYDPLTLHDGTLVNDPIEYWTDSASGYTLHGNDYAYPVPVLHDDVQHGLPAAYFDGSAKYLRSDTAPGFNSFTAFVAFKAEVGNVNSIIFSAGLYGDTAFQSPDMFYALGWEGGYPSWAFGDGIAGWSNGIGDKGSPAFVLDKWYVAAFRYTTADIFMDTWEKYTQIPPLQYDSDATALLGTNDEMNMGAYGDYAFYHWKGYIGEYEVWDDALDDESTLSILQLYAQRWFGHTGTVITKGATIQRTFLATIPDPGFGSIPPVDPDFFPGTAIEGLGEWTAANLETTVEGTEPTGSNTIWWKWIVPADGDYRFDFLYSLLNGHPNIPREENSDWQLDTIMDIYQGPDIANLISVGSNDDSSRPEMPSPSEWALNSRIELTGLITDDVYYVRGDTFSAGDWGNFVLTISEL